MRYSRPARTPPAGRKGYHGPGGGWATFVDVPEWYRGTSRHVCANWPFGTGTPPPAIGVPLGYHLYSGHTVFYDPVNWFTRTRLTTNPSLFILGAPGAGKSTAVRRMTLGLSAQGIMPLILGDLKPDYAPLVTALGGQVIQVGPGLDRINPLDVGPWQDLQHDLLGKAPARTRESVAAGVIDRRLNIVQALAGLIRHHEVSYDESVVLAAAIRYLTVHARTSIQPLLSDVLQVIIDPPPDVTDVTVWDDADVQHHVSGLRRTLMALLNGPLQSTLDGPTTKPIDVDTAAVCVDISGIHETDQLRTAAMMLTTWSYGFAVVDGAHAAADIGAAPQRTFVAVLDEMWRVLRAHPHLVELCDMLTRLNRHKATGTIFCVHSMKDLEAVAAEDQAKSAGFADRAAALLIGPSTVSELDAVARVRPLSRAERREVLSWNAASTQDATGDSSGLGCFLLKLGSRQAIPVGLQPTDIELRLGDTNQRWNLTGRTSAVT